MRDLPRRAEIYGACMPVYRVLAGARGKRHSLPAAAERNGSGNARGSAYIRFTFHDFHLPECTKSRVKMTIVNEESSARDCRSGR